ncbi:MAG: alpha-L-fucosidase [Tepidisphaeraceae bacterium]
MANTLPTRQIHLDFHTGPAIPDVGRDFNADEFARTLADAHVNSVTLFAKCHHGHLYYDTNSPARHPSLPKNVHLLEQQIEACKRHGIRTPIYISVQCDEFAANEHPEWIAVREDKEHGRLVGRHPLRHDAFQWQILDMSSPYADYLAQQIEEVVTKFKPVDGIFLDMCWDQISVSKWAKAGMKKLGLDAASETDRNTYALGVVHGYMERYNALIARCNNGELPRVWYNSRPKLKLTQEAKYLKHVEIEALPTGGWGYTYFPLNVRFARNFGLPFIGMTGRFHKSWSDFGGIKPAAALKYEVAQMLAHGGGCSVGDQLHPRGTFERGAYQLIGQAYAHVEACESWCVGAEPVTEIGILRDVTGGYHITPGDPLEGVVRLLQQTFQQFDFIHTGSDVSKCSVIVLPDGHPFDESIDALLLRWAKQGKKIIVVGQENVTKLSPALCAIVGVADMQPKAFDTVFLRYDASVVTGLFDVDHVLYEPTLKLTPSSGASGLAQIVEPYFDRRWDHFCGHNQTPGAWATESFATTVGNAGAAFGFDLFGQYATHGNLHLKRLLAAVMDRLLPKPLTKSDAPSHVELTVTKHDARHVVHVLSYAPQRRTPKLDLVEEPTPLVEVSVSLRLDRKPAKVTQQPAGLDLPFSYADGYATVKLTSNNGHDLLVFE